jgi:hypothetical protein
MLDHVFLTVSDIRRSISFYEAALAPLGINERFDYDGKNGPPGHPDLKGFGANGRLYLWLREGISMAAQHMSVLYPIAGNRSKQPTPPRSRQELATTARPASGSTMTRATTPPTCWILTVTASSSFTRIAAMKRGAFCGNLFSSKGRLP